jgi:hypothetical protein
MRTSIPAAAAIASVKVGCREAATERWTMSYGRSFDELADRNGDRSTPDAEEAARSKVLLDRRNTRGDQ